LLILQNHQHAPTVETVSIYGMNAAASWLRRQLANFKQADPREGAAIASATVVLAAFHPQFYGLEVFQQTRWSCRKEGVQQQFDELQQLMDKSAHKTTTFQCFRHASCKNAEAYYRATYQQHFFDGICATRCKRSELAVIITKQNQATRQARHHRTQLRIRGGAVLNRREQGYNVGQLVRQRYGKDSVLSVSQHTGYVHNAEWGGYGRRKKCARRLKQLLAVS